MVWLPAAISRSLRAGIAEIAARAVSLTSAVTGPRAVFPDVLTGSFAADEAPASLSPCCGFGPRRLSGGAHDRAHGVGAVKACAGAVVVFDELDADLAGSHC